MVSAARLRTLQAWATVIYWTGKVTGVLVADVVTKKTGTVRQHKFTTAAAFSVNWWQWARTRAWNAACLVTVAYRIGVETWPVTVQATRMPQASCYDTVCGSVWCVYACVYYAVAWLDRASELVALAAAVTWRRAATVVSLNSAAAGCLDDEDNGDSDDENKRPSTADVPWHAYLAATFPAVQFVTVAYAVSPTKIDVWRTAIAAVTALSSCAPIAAHGTAAALLIVANNSMRSINHRVTRLKPAAGLQQRREPTFVDGGLEDDAELRQRATIARLAHRHWRTTELVSRGVCDAYSADLMAAVLMAAVRITYVAISVFHRLTDDTDAEENARTTMSLAVVMHLIAWFGQFVYLAYTCDELMAQVLFVV